MLQANGISVIFGDRHLIKPVSLTVGDKERIGLVGRNGAGKSTLFRIISGDMSPHEGTVTQPREYMIGYLRQELPTNANRTVMEEVMSSFEDLNQMKVRLTELEKELETREDYTSQSYLDLIEQFTHLQERVHVHGPGNIDKQIELVLTGLGFSRDEFSQPVSTFSGGWRMRIELAKLLLQQPDLLLLDEPTNHLDIHSIIWLEGFLRDYPGSLILVSHDTTFMDRLVNRVLEIEFGNLHDYKSGYRKFLELKEERIEKSMAAHKNQQREIAQTKRNIERFRYKKSKAKFAQTLIRKLEKTEIIEIEQQDSASMRFRFPEGTRAGDIVVKLRDISKQFDEKKVLEGVNLDLMRGEKVAFVGKNGMGKTTLARIIAGDLDASAGKVLPGYNMELNYFAQMQSGTLDADQTVLETIDQAATGDLRTRTRSLLGAFLFSGEDVDKKVKVLSGGERSRLALAKLLLQPSNFLLLDEPTNHLDVYSKGILKQAVMAYGGASIIVSHDRDFLEGLTTRVIEFTENGLKEYLGDINFFLSENGFDNIRDFELEKQEPEAGPEAVTKPSGRGGNDYKQRKERAREERKLRNQAGKLESRISDLETRKQEMIGQLQTAYDEDLARNYHELEKELEQLTEDWMTAQEKLEEFLADN